MWRVCTSVDPWLTEMEKRHQESLDQVSKESEYFKQAAREAAKCSASCTSFKHKMHDVAKDLVMEVPAATTSCGRSWRSTDG